MPDEPAGTIRGAIGRDPRNRLKYTIRERRQAAVTHYALREQLRGASELSSGSKRDARIRSASTSPRSGIRWSTIRSTAAATRALPLAGQALHAWRLRFKHPRTKQMIAFESEPPPEYLATLAILRDAPK